MKKIALFGSFLIFSFTGLQASQPYDDLVKLVKSGAGEEVIVAYISASDSNYTLSSDEILHLKEYGASSKVIIAAIQHKGKVSANQKNQAAPAETSSAVHSSPYVVYRAAPPARPWRVVNTYWLGKVQKMNQAFQIDVYGLMSGALTLNYEYLLYHQHGIVVEGSYYEGWDSHAENAELAYRWHWDKSMHSGFLGVFINGGRSYGNQVDLPGNLVAGYTQTSVTVGPDIGKRWVAASGLSVVARIGYGYTWSDFNWDPNSPVPDQGTVDRLIMNAGLDYELSLGYAF